MTRFFAIVREALASARSQYVSSALTILMIAGMLLAVMLTTGRTVGAEQQVLQSIDSSGSRSITVRAENGAGVRTDVLDRIQMISGIEWAAGFSSAEDGTNALLPGTARVPVRHIYGTRLARLGIPERPALEDGAAYASERALKELGFTAPSGGMVLNSGAELGVVGEIAVPDFLMDLEPLVVVPGALSEDHTINILIVIAQAPELVAPVSATLKSVLAADDPSKVTIRTSEALATLRSIVQGQLNSFSRGLVLALMALTGVLVMVILYGLVMMRRKDFGRRRALGASRSMIISLLLLQTSALAFLGIVIGAGVAALFLVISGDPLPPPAFVGAIGILTFLTAILAALVPAVIASRREPIKELRVP